METVQLLPKGKFVITESATVEHRGRFSLYAIDAFCDEHNIANYLDLIDLISTSMRIGQYADLLKHALNDSDRDKPRYTKTQVMDLMDEVFDSVLDPEFTKLFNHLVGRVATLPPLPEGKQAEETEEEKKKEPNAPEGNLTEGSSAT